MASWAGERPGRPSREYQSAKSSSRHSSSRRSLTHIAAVPLGLLARSICAVRGGTCSPERGQSANGHLDNCIGSRNTPSMLTDHADAPGSSKIPDRVKSGGRPSGSSRPEPGRCVRTAPAKAHLIQDGTFLRVDRIAADRPFRPGRHKKHGMTRRSSPPPSGGCCGPHRPCPAPFPTSAWPANPASSTPSPRQASRAGPTWDTERSATPSAYRARGARETLSAGQQAANRAHVTIRGLVEQAAALKSWHLLRELRCSTIRNRQPHLGRPHSSSGEFGARAERLAARLGRGGRHRPFPQAGRRGSCSGGSAP